LPECDMEQDLIQQESLEGVIKIVKDLIAKADTNIQRLIKE